MNRRKFAIGSSVLAAAMSTQAATASWSLAVSANNIVTLLHPNGQKFPVDATRIDRIRSWAPSDELPPGTTRIDWLEMDYATESLAKIVAAVVAIVPTFRSLLSPLDQPIWFDAKSAVGPWPFPNGQLAQKNVHSAIKLGSHVQYLKSAPEEVAACINGAGGTPLVPGNTPLVLLPQTLGFQQVWSF